jgi:hypothetical protein
MQILEVLVVQEQILVQVFQEHQTQEFMQVVAVVAQDLLVDLEELVVEEMQLVDHNQEEMVQQILVVAVEEQKIQPLQCKVVMVVQE